MYLPSDHLICIFSQAPMGSQGSVGFVLEEGPASFFCKGVNSECFRLCGTAHFCCLSVRKATLSCKQMGVARVPIKLYLENKALG